MSYIRVTRGRWADPGTPSSEAGRQAAQELFETVTGTSGNQSFIGGIDASSGMAIAISVWHTEEHARGFGPTPPRSAIVEKLEALGLPIEPSEVFEVTTPT
jgi:hypothetical protein